MKILIIDDNRDLLEMVAYTLGLSGHQIFRAENGYEGIKEAGRKKPDLILLDIMMPQLDGFQTLQKMKSDRKLKEIPVFMLTALDKMSDVEKAFQLGADDYITKPFENDKLSCIINRKMDRLKSEKAQN